MTHRQLQASNTTTPIRIDLWLKQMMPEISRSHIQFLIDSGQVTCNGKPVKKRSLVQSNDQVSFHYQQKPQSNLTPVNIPLEVLYEDDHLIAINKPKGMVVHPAPGNYDNTLVHALLYHCKIEDTGEELRPGIVHRLDKDTSGVILCAKTAEVKHQLMEQFANRQIQKEYIALCVQAPKSLSCDGAITRHPVHRKKMHVSDEGKASHSDFEIIEQGTRLCEVLAKPTTGRTHQIRVHLKALNAPILGDELYGSTAMNLRYKVSGQCLHSYRLTFTHPITKKVTTITAPKPNWQDLLAK